MSVRQFGPGELGTIAAILGAAPADLALVSEANRRCYRAAYPADEASSEPVAAEAIAEAARATTISKAGLVAALHSAANLHYNCEHDRDFCTDATLIALGRITRAALSLSAMVVENPAFAEHHAEELRRMRWEAETEAEMRAERIRKGPRERTTEQTVYRTGTLKRRADWKGNLSEFLKIGDAVDEGLYDHVLEVLFPAHMSSQLLQMGEAMDHGPRGTPRFLTLQRHGAQWIYTGIQYAGDRVTVK